MLSEAIGIDDVDMHKQIDDMGIWVEQVSHGGCSISAHVLVETCFWHPFWCPTLSFSKADTRIDTPRKCP